jgi:hypothetical protein
MASSGRRPTAALIGAAGCVAAGAVVAVEPWGRCGFVGNRYEAFALDHPRVHFLLILSIVLGLAAIATRGGAAMRGTSHWCWAPIAMATWLAFEAKSAVHAAIWLWGSPGPVARTLWAFRGSLLWLFLWLVGLASMMTFRRSLSNGGTEPEETPSTASAPSA